MTTPIAHCPVAPTTASCPATLTAPEWDEAFLRVESYLRAHHTESRVLLNCLTSQIIDVARQQAAQFPGDEPVELAMRVAHERIGAWLEGVGHVGDWTEVRVRTRARLALAVTGLSGRWAGQLFSTHPVSPEFATELAAATLHPGPELSLSNMPTAPLEFGFDAAAATELRQTSGWSLVRGAGWSVGLIGLFGLVWAQTH